MKKNVKLTVLLVLLLILILLGVGYFWGFNKNGEKNAEKNNNSKSNAKKIQIVDANSKSRPYAIMINNISAARPVQSGLQDAYIIYEMIVEGGITRYLALFMDQSTERIGSVRSARHYYLDYALENDAIYVHHGKSPQADADFSKLKIDRIEINDSTTGWRDKTLNVAYEHTLFTNIEKLNSGLGKKRTERNKDLLLNYTIETVDLSQYENSQEANEISIKYSNATTSSYKYDAEGKVYNRFVNDKEHTDYVTKKQYNFKNIIAYSVSNSSLNDGSGKDRQTLDNVGTGEGYYFTNGYAIPIVWEKPSRSEQTVYKYKENGKEIDVSDGNTFIQIYPTNGELIFK